MPTLEVPSFYMPRDQAHRQAIIKSMMTTVMLQFGATMNKYNQGQIQRIRFWGCVVQ
jgi:hypothetical protein